MNTVKIACLLLAVLTACQPWGRERPFPPFREKQFGAAHVQVTSIDPSLYAKVSLLVLKPQDARTLDHVHLEDFWLNPATLGVRRGMPYDIDHWLRDELHMVMKGIPHLIPLTASEYKALGNQADLALQATILETEVANYGPLPQYRCSVKIDFMLLDAAGKPLWSEVFPVAVTKVKSFTLEGDTHTPIAPLVEDTMGMAIQQLVDHEPFLIALRNVSRRR